MSKLIPVRFRMYALVSSITGEIYSKKGYPLLWAQRQVAEHAAEYQNLIQTPHEVRDVFVTVSEIPDALDNPHLPEGASPGGDSQLPGADSAAH